MKTKNSYVFEQLDNMVAFELNPAFSYPNPMPNETVQIMIRNVTKETQRLQNEFRSQFFNLKNEETSAALIVKNYDAVILMMNKAYGHMHHAKIEEANILPVLEAAMTCLQDLRLFFQTNFGKYLTPDQFLPVTELMGIREMIISKREALVKKLHENGNGDEVSSIVLDPLYEFAEKIASLEPIRLREADYYKMIITDIENYSPSGSVLSNCPSLHELLLFWNLNSKACIRYFSVGMENIMKSQETVEEQLEFMRLQQKNVNTLPQNPGFIYNAEFPSIKVYFSDYVSNEIAYLENKKIGFLPNEAYAAEQNKAAPFKILCALSADQIGLFLRATKDLKIVLSRSLSSVFAAIVPFISTQKETDLSPDSLRIKSYQSEDRDKDILIGALQKMIETVKGY